MSRSRKNLRRERAAKLQAAETARAQKRELDRKLVVKIAGGIAFVVAAFGGMFFALASTSGKTDPLQRLPDGNHGVCYGAKGHNDRFCVAFLQSKGKWAHVRLENFGPTGRSGTTTTP